MWVECRDSPNLPSPLNRFQCVDQPPCRFLAYVRRSENVLTKRMKGYGVSRPCRRVISSVTELNNQNVYASSTVLF